MEKEIKFRNEELYHKTYQMTKRKAEITLRNGLVQQECVLYSQ